jgi:hypothetical protein
MTLVTHCWECACLLNLYILYHEFIFCFFCAVNWIVKLQTLQVPPFVYSFNVYTHLDVRKQKNSSYHP